MKSENQVKNGPLKLFIASICSFIGAGFITGAEIWHYFARFENDMILGVISFSILFYFLILFCFKSSKNENTKTKKIKTAVSIFSEIVISAAMISGIKQMTKNQFYSDWLALFLIVVLVIFLLLFLNIKYFLFYNYFVVGFVIAFTLSLFAILDVKFDLNLQELSFDNSCKSLIYACFYAFMNIAGVRPIIERIEFKNNSQANKKRFSFLLVFALILLILILSIFLISNKYLTLNSMPFLLLFNNKNIALKIIFIIGLLMALVSTAISCLGGAASKVDLIFDDEKFSKSFIFIFVLLLSFLSFDFFIQIFYPIIAVLNAILFFVEICKK